MSYPNEPDFVVVKVGDGATYDPRLDSSVVGGSGSHRADDQSTWEWDDDASRNPALQLLWYLIGWRINGIVSIGCGIPPARIDLESFITAANLCDESVALAAGGTEPRYRSDGVFSDGDEPTNVIDNLKAAMNADLDDVGGKFRLTVFHNDLADPGPSFGDDDMIEGFRWVQTPALSDSFNIVRGSYTDTRDTALYQLVDAPPVELESRDGIDRFDGFDLAYVQSPSQWQRLASQRLQRQQYGGEFTTTFNARGWNLCKNMVIPLSFTRLGWSGKLFRIAEMEHRVDGACPVVLREENAAIYAWDKDERPAVEPADPTLYNFTLSPVLQGIEEAAEWQGVHKIVAQSPLFPVTTDDDSIDIAAFDGTLDDGTEISFPADSIGGLPSGTKYGVFWHLADEEYVATAEPSTAEIGSNDYVFIGWAATLSSGVPRTTRWFSAPNRRYRAPQRTGTFRGGEPPAPAGS